MSSRCQLLGVTGIGLAYLGARLTALAVEDRDRVTALVIRCARMFGLSFRPVLTYVAAPARKMRNRGQATKTSQIAIYLGIQTHALGTQSSNMGCEL